MRRAPAFWWTERPTASACLLQPLGAMYGGLTARRMARRGLALTVPVLCVGNLVAGGAGKTPTALALAALLSARGHRPAFLSRGYGRSTTGQPRDHVIEVEPDRHGAEAVGDEPLLLAATAPTYVSADRPAAARRALAGGASVVILDDGLQNPTLAKTFSIAVIDGGTGFGNGLCLPAGPLRAPPARQWPFVHAVCLIGRGSMGDEAAMLARRHHVPVLRAQLRPDPAEVDHLRGRPLFAFAGMGRPEKFFATLEACGLDLRGTRAFPDHHVFSSGDRAALMAAAQGSGAALVTTTKDRVRLPREFPATTLPVTLQFDDPAEVLPMLDAYIPRPAP